jgi:integrase
MHFLLAFASFVPTLERMATLYKKPNSPFYFAQYFDADGKRVSKSTGIKAKREARRVAEKYEADERDTRNKSNQLPKAFAAILEVVAREAAAGELTLAKAEEHVAKMHRLANPEHKEISLRDFWTQWIDDQRAHVVQSTMDNYHDDLKRLAEGLGEKVMAASVQSLTEKQVKAALEKLVKKGGRKGSTINLALSSLRRVMESAVAQKLATHNPAKQCRLVSESDSIERAPFTVEEIRAMLDHSETSDEWRGAIIIASHTGLRIGDVVKLSTKNVDGNRLVVVPTKTIRLKKVVKAITVPMTPACIKWIGERKGDFFPKLKKQSKPTTSMQFGAIMKKAGVAKMIELAGGIKASRSFHSSRHTFASLLAEANVSEEVRQKMTGHESSKMHQRYTHHDKALDRAIETLPEL